MKHGSLFSGIGGFDLAAQWVGWENIFHVERDPFCQQVLRHHFPKSESYEDIKKFDGSAYFGRVDIISGGFPCQPFSAAGKRGGTSDNRYLWPEMYRVIQQARPTYVVAENVRGLISWNEGMVLDTVCADLEGEGYEVLPVVLPAASVNAPHRRERIWIVANAIDSRREDWTEQHRRCETPSRKGQPSLGGCGTWPNSADASNTRGMGRERRGSEKAEGRQGQRPWVQPNTEGQSSGADASNPNRKQLEGRNGQGTPCQSAHTPQRIESPDGPRAWETFPTVAPVCGGDDGLPKELDGITFQKWRRESIKAYGNAIVPQVALQIFRAIEQDVQSRI